MTDQKRYVVATAGPWHIEAFYRLLRGHVPGEWTLVSAPGKLTLWSLEQVEPEYIFFPQWRYQVPKEITDRFECICFHETDVPFGRGGTPIQNLIDRGDSETVISAIRMTDELDAGPVYFQQPLCLNGSAEEIYIRSAQLIASMIIMFVGGLAPSTPTPQEGNVITFKRRVPSESVLPKTDTLGYLFDFIRMLDAEGYPHAFIDYGPLRLSFSRASLRVGRIEADVRIELRE